MPDRLISTPSFGGDVKSHWKTALDFAQNARGATPEAAGTADATRGLAAADAPPGAAAPTAMGEAVALTAVPGNDPDGLAAAARAAAEQSLVDPAARAAMTPQADFIVQPIVTMEAPKGPTVIPVNVAIPAPQSHVAFAPAQIVMVDGATGQQVATGSAAASTPGGAPASTTRGFRNWGVGDINELLTRGRGGGVADDVVAAHAAESPATGGRLSGLQSGLERFAQAARGPATPAVSTVAVEAAASAPAGPSPLDRFRAATGALGGSLTRTGSLDDAASAGAEVVSRAASGGAAGLGAAREQLLSAFDLAKRVNPRG